MNEFQLHAYRHPQTNAWGSLPLDFYRRMEIGPHLLAVALSVNR